MKLHIYSDSAILSVTSSFCFRGKAAAVVNGDLSSVVFAYRRSEGCSEKIRRNHPELNTVFTHNLLEIRARSAGIWNCRIYDWKFNRISPGNGVSRWEWFQQRTFLGIYFKTAGVESPGYCDLWTRISRESRVSLQDWLAIYLFCFFVHLSR